MSSEQSRTGGSHTGRSSTFWVVAAREMTVVLNGTARILAVMLDAIRGSRGSQKAHRDDSCLYIFDLLFAISSWTALCKIGQFRE